MMYCGKKFSIIRDLSNLIILRGRILAVILCLFILFNPVDAKAQKSKVPGEDVFIISCLKNIFVNVNLNDASAAMKAWAQQLEHKLGLGIKIEIKIFNDINELLNYPGKDELGVIMSNSVDYLKYKSKMQAYPVFNPSIYDDYLLLVKNEKYKKPGDLKGKKLGILSIESNPIPGMWFNVFLYKNKLGTKDKFFGSVEEFKSESQLILAVFFDKKDACIVSRKSFETMNELNPQVGNILKSIAFSPVYSIGVSCLSKNSKKFSYINRFIDVTLNLDSYPEGKQFMSLMKTEKIMPYKPENIESVERLFKEFETLPLKNRYQY